MNIENIIEEERPESETLEYKRKRAEHQAIAEELVAFANNKGGTLILGVHEEDDSIVDIQDIKSTSETEEGIQNVIASSVEPRLRISPSHEKFEGNQLLGLEVENDGRIHSIEINSRPVFPYRQGSRKDYLHGYELDPRTSDRLSDEVQRQTVTGGNPSESDNKYDFSISNDWVGGVSRSGSLDDISPASPSNYSSPSNRLLTEVAERTIVIPGKIGINPFNLDTLTYKLEDNIAIRTEEDIERIIYYAEEILEASVTRDLSYAISFNHQQIVGRHVENFIEDSNRINRLVARMHPGSGNPSDPRPVGIITIPVLTGLLWIQVQWRGSSLRPSRGKCGVILPNIPFNQSHLREFFDSIGDTPLSYNQKSRIQHLSLNSNHQLSKPEPTLLKTELEDVYTEVIADNPLYQQPDALSDAFDTGIPARFCDAISSVSRLPFDVAGGWIASDEQFKFTDMDILAIDTMYPAYVVDLISHSQSEDNDLIDPFN